MFDEHHIHRHEDLTHEVNVASDRLKYYLVADPGTKTVFGMLFIAYDKWTNTIFILDEIYETKPENTRVQHIYNSLREKAKGVGPRDLGTWIKMYDPAAAWFGVEISQFVRGFSPCRKRAGDKEEAISLIKDIFSARSVCKVSDQCSSFIHEMKYYKTDESGRAVDSDDHLIDCFRYFLKFINYRFKKEKPEPEGDPVDRRRAFSLEADMKKHFGRKNWASNILSKY